MISLIIERAEVRLSGDGKTYHVIHPSNGAILAYCDTEEEAIDVRSALQSLGRQYARLNRETPRIRNIVGPNLAKETGQ